MWNLVVHKLVPAQSGNSVCEEATYVGSARMPSEARIHCPHRPVESTDDQEHRQVLYGTSKEQRVDYVDKLYASD